MIKNEPFNGTLQKIHQVPKPGSHEQVESHPPCSGSSKDIMCCLQIRLQVHVAQQKNRKETRPGVETRPQTHENKNNRVDNVVNQDPQGFFFPHTL